MSYKKRGVERRRSADVADFPWTSPSGELVDSDRRSGPDRRRLGRIAVQAIFENLDYSTLESLAKQCEIRQLQPGERLLSPGQMNHHLYLVLDGCLNVHLDKEDGEGGFLIEPGECTGEISIIDGRPASAFVVAAEPSAVLAVPEADFWSRFMPNPEIARNFMRLFAERFRARSQLMQKALEERLRYEHLEKELGIAQEIQAGMLPRKLDLRPELDIVAEMVPARHVGGDFFDVFAIGNDDYCIAVGDVSGKGVPAALFMVRAMTLLRTEMLKPQSLESAVQALNAALCRDNARCMFVTLVVGVLNRRGGAFRFVVAGHNPLIFGDAAGNYRYLPSPAGLLAGVDESATYETASVTLNRGEVLMLYTDGITEAMNGGHELFSEARLLDCLQGASSDSAEELAGRVNRAVKAFVAEAPSSDDLTLVILRYQGA